MTIYDIAKLAGVSASSVSRVINGKPGVNREARQRIELLLRQNHYTPDENARSLVMQTSRTIGILTDDIASSRQNEGTSKVEYEMMRNGYYCFVKYIGNDENAIEDGFIDLASRRVVGALLLGVSFRRNKEVEQAVRRHLPDTPVMLVNHYSETQLENVYCVGTNERKGFVRCVDMMVKKGRKNIALMVDARRVSSELIRTTFEERIKSYPAMNGWVYMGVEPNTQGGAQAVEHILQEHPEVDALICAQDLIAIGAMNQLLDNGIEVPRQIAILGEDNSTFCEVCRPRLSSLDTMLSTVSIMAARTLLDVLEKRETSHQITLDMEIVERGST